MTEVFESTFRNHKKIIAPSKTILTITKVEFTTFLNTLF